MLIYTNIYLYLFIFWWEQEYEAVGKNLEKKEEELLALEEKLSAREKVSACHYCVYSRKSF